MNIDTGDLLIAPPGMKDARFAQTVLLITEHDIFGTKALCLNRGLNNTVNQMIQTSEYRLLRDRELFWGGPVNTTNLWLLHEKGWNCDNTVDVNDLWSISSSINMFTDLNVTQPDYQRFCLGFASWYPGQLELEIQGEPPWTESGSWLVAHRVRPEQIFRTNSRDLWHWACELAADQAVSHWLT